jgi:hypothetical protein
VTQKGEKRNAYGILVGKPKEREGLKDIDVDGRIMLKLILKRDRMGGRRLDWPG